MPSTLFDPIIYLLALGFGLGAYLTQEFQGVSYLQFIAPGLVASSVMMASAYETAWNLPPLDVQTDRRDCLTISNGLAGPCAWA